MKKVRQMLCLFLCLQILLPAPVLANSTESYRQKLTYEYQKLEKIQKDLLELKEKTENETREYLNLFLTNQSRKLYDLKNMKNKQASTPFINFDSESSSSHSYLLKEAMVKENKEALNKKSASLMIEMLESRQNLQIAQNFQELCKESLSLKEFEENGEPVLEAVFNPDAPIPNIGGIKSRLQADLKACLSFDLNELIDSGSIRDPFPQGYLSAGTWAYPSGGLHLGADFAMSMYSPVLAPANGLILYANTPVSSDCGYLGNYCGYPQGGGNTICLICPIDSKLYCFTFAHLSNRFNVRTGQKVNQGDVIAYSGNSGNSTGPHCHIEVFVLKRSLEESIDYFSNGADFSWGCGWKDPYASSYYGQRIRPELLF